MQIAIARTPCRTLIPKASPSLTQYTSPSGPEVVVRKMSLKSLLAAPAHRFPFVAVAEQPHGALSKAANAVAVGEEPRFLISYDLRNSARSRPYTRLGMVHRFEKNDSKTFF